MAFGYTLIDAAERRACLSSATLWRTSRVLSSGVLAISHNSERRLIAQARHSQTCGAESTTLCFASVQPQRATRCREIRSTGWRLHCVCSEHVNISIVAVYEKIETETLKSITEV